MPNNNQVSAVEIEPISGDNVLYAAKCCLAEKGYVILHQAVSRAFVSLMRDHFEKVRQRFHHLPPDTWSHWLFEGDCLWYQLITAPESLNLVRGFLGPNIAHLASHYWARSPKSGTTVPWHQDGAYFELRGGELITFWIPMDSVTPENGCLCVIPGSHLSGYLPLVSASRRLSEN